MAGIVAAKIFKNRRNVKGRVEGELSKVLAILDHDRSGRVKLEHFLDIMEEHDVEMLQEEELELLELANDQGDIGINTLIVYMKNCRSWKQLERLEAGEKTKMEMIHNRIKRVYAAFTSLDQNKDGLVTKKDFKSKFTNLPESKIQLIFKRYNHVTSGCSSSCQEDTSLNFVQFKNFMNRRPPHQDLASRRNSILSSLSSIPSFASSTLSLFASDLESALPPRYSSLSDPPRYSSLSDPPSYSTLSINEPGGLNSEAFACIPEQQEHK